MKKRLQRIIFVGLIFASNFVLSQDWQFDADSLRDEGPIVPMILNPLVDGYTPEIDYSNDIETGKKYNGYRVQILSTKSVQLAEDMRRKLASQINHNVRVIFEAPNYKVRVGGFTVRQDADRLRNHLYALGYRRAWVVRAHIIF